MDLFLVTFFLSVAGLVNAFQLYFQYQRHKTFGQKMFCLVGDKCTEVIGSKYGQTLGVKNELIGMAYYLLLIFYSLTNLIFPKMGAHFATLMIGPVILATVFSLYLLIIQTVVLKKLCSWCLMAIFLNILIFSLIISLI